MEETNEKVLTANECLQQIDKYYDNSSNYNDLYNSNVIVEY